jgi:hypothetical protein
MARETFTSLQTIAHEATQTASTDSNVNTFLKSWINRGYRFIQSDLDNFTTQIVRTTSTVGNQQYYYKPPNIVTIESIVVTINNVDYVLESVGSQRHWDALNAITFSGTAIPSAFFQRRDDFGIWPILQDAYTMTMSYVPRYKDLTAEDYTTGTVDVTNDSAAVTGNGTAFTAHMVGRWLTTDDDGEWYRIASVTDGTNLTLENVFQGTTATTASYRIGETPEIPDELHELPAYYAAQAYFIQKRKNSNQAAVWGNVFFTGDPQNSSRNPSEASGGLLGAKKRYSKRASTAIVRHRKRIRGDIFLEKAWATVISPS